MQNAICKVCGKSYQNKSGRSGYCDECQAKRTAENKHKHYEKRKEIEGLAKQLMTIETRKCTKCGREFQPANAWKKICPVCEAEKAHEGNLIRSNQYKKENWDMVHFKLLKDERERLKDFADLHNMPSMTELIYLGIALSEIVLENKISGEWKDELIKKVTTKGDISSYDFILPDSAVISALNTIAHAGRSDNDSYIEQKGLNTAESINVFKVYNDYETAYAILLEKSESKEGIPAVAVTPCACDKLVKKLNDPGFEICENGFCVIDSTEKYKILVLNNFWDSKDYGITENTYTSNKPTVFRVYNNTKKAIEEFRSRYEVFIKKSDNNPENNRISVEISNEIYSSFTAKVNDFLNEQSLIKGYEIYSINTTDKYVIIVAEITR